MEADRLSIGTVAKGELKGQCRIGGIDRIQSLGRRAAISTHRPQCPIGTEREAGDLIGQHSYRSRDSRVGIDRNQSPGGFRRLDDSEEYAVTRPCGHRL